MRFRVGRLGSVIIRDCSSHWCDQCKTCERGRCCRNDDPQHRLPEVGEITPFYGDLGVRSDWGDRVECHVCGDWYISVGSHSWIAHDLTAAEYKAAFGLTNKGLISEDYRGRMSAARKVTSKGRVLLGRPTAEQRRHSRRSLEGANVSREIARKHLARMPRSPELMAKINASRHKNAMVTLNCVVCEVTFEKIWHRRTKTCSETCRRESSRRDMLQRVADGNGPRPPEMTDEIKRKLSTSAKERWAVADDKEREAAKERLMRYLSSRTPEQIQAQRQSAGRARGAQTRQPHPCTAGCGTIIPTKHPLTCSPECRRKVRQETSLKANALRWGPERTEAS